MIKIEIDNMLGRTMKTNIGSSQEDSASSIVFILYSASRKRKLKIRIVNSKSINLLNLTPTLRSESLQR